MKDREIKSGWKVVQRYEGKLYSATMTGTPNFHKASDREYAVNRWTRHHHKAGPLAVFTYHAAARSFLKTENRYHTRLEIYACKYIISKHLKLWEEGGAVRELVYLPGGTALAKCVQLRRI